MRHGSAPPASFEMFDGGFLIGTVPGCDVRLPAADLPPVLCLITRTTGGVGLRKLVPTAPVLVNGKPMSVGMIAHGDRVGIGPVELSVAVQIPAELQKFREQNGEALFPPAPFPVFRYSPQELEERARQLDVRQHQLNEQTAELETDRVIWYRRREEIEQECRQVKDQERDLAAARAKLEEERKAIQPEQERLNHQRAELQAKAEQLTAQEKELDAYRQQLDERYRERRDRIAGLQEAVNKAAANVQERKRQLQAEIQQASTQLQEHASRKANLDSREADLNQKLRELDDQRKTFNGRQHDLQQQLADRLNECQTRERQVVEDRQALDQNQAKYQADLLRLDRLAATLEERQKELQDRSADIERRFEELQQANREMEAQALELRKLEKQVQEISARLAVQKVELDAAAAQTAQRAAHLESQQALLATLRTRLEKQRDDLRRDELQLTEQRNRQGAVEADLQRRVKEVHLFRSKWDEEQRHHEQERRQIQERAAAMETAVDRLRELEEKLTEEKVHLDQWSQELNAQATQQAEEADALEARAARIVEEEQKVADDRRALREREAALIQAEQAREALQEQLRRRSEELAARQRELAEQSSLGAEQLAALEARRKELHQNQSETEQRLTSLQQELDGRTVVLNQLQADLASREQALSEDIERLKTAARNLAAGKKSLADHQAQWEIDQKEVASQHARQREELHALRDEIRTLQGQLPELEQQARDSCQKLTEARRQLREHLTELHSYAHQAQDDLETVRAQVRVEAEQVRQQETGLHKSREDQRLAVAAFRQQLIDYQGQLTEMKRTLDQGEHRLERRQAEVNEAARQIDATSARLAKQAEEIQEQERAVAERRDEMERHLADMREWYRQKLRELAEGKGAAHVVSGISESKIEDRGSEAEDEEARHILPMNEEIDEGDQKLGDLLRSLELVDADSLSALLVEARKQRRSLRQMLLSSGFVTLYQMAMIEAGNFDSLVLGPLRVMDRLRVAAQETVYRVFDPRRDVSGSTEPMPGSALLRHLSESATTDAACVEEFRAGFSAASKVWHPNLAATWEVLDIHDRPAVLQEWLTGLPSSDWPSLASAPSVWFRLLRQATQGLRAAHSAGLIHNHLQANRILLTPNGIVKIAGFGEPDWLVSGNPKSEIRNPKPGSHGLNTDETPNLDPCSIHVSSMSANSDFASDVADLCRIAAAWAAPSAKKKGGKAKPFPKPLRAILERLKTEDADARYLSAAALLEDLDQAANQIPDNPEAWDKLLSHIRDTGKEDVPLKQSA
jgi:DNA repair exonuclease SbcCD ATPase subunit